MVSKPASASVQILNVARKLSNNCHCNTLLLEVYKYEGEKVGTTMVVEALAGAASRYC